jgi:L-alanine-DL-glutamate epimerase-like enolase superfamily enzyme
VIETAVQDLQRILIGEDPTHIERLWQRMMSAIMVHGLTGTVGAGAMTGIDMALWDIKGKVLAHRSGTCSAARCATRSASMRMPTRPKWR